jgi:type II secretory pathway pseudopilin PulG
MKKEKGFTLINLIIIIVAVSIAAAIAVELLTVSEQERMKALTLNRMKDVMKAVYGDTELIPQNDFGYVADIGELPNSLNDLINDTGNPNWNGPYLTTDISGSDAGNLLKDGYGNPFVYDKENGTIGTAEGSPVDVQQKFQYSPKELTNGSLRGTVTDRVGHPPKSTDLENVYISLIYTVDKTVAAAVEPQGPGERKGWQPFWWKWDIASNQGYNWIWKIQSRTWWGGKKSIWWHEGLIPWWEEDGDYQPQLRRWSNWYQTTSDSDWWNDLIINHPEQKKWAFWWWWRHWGRHRPNPPQDTETLGRFLTIHPNADGTYSFENVPVGNYTVEASHDLLGVSIEKPIAIQPAKENTVNFKFNPIFPDYPGYGEDMGASEMGGLRVSYHDLIINGYSDDDIRLANGRTQEMGAITIDKIKVSWSDATITEKINKITIDGQNKWTGGWGWSSGEKSGTIIDIANYKIQPQESGKVLELFFNNNLNPKTLELVFILDDGSELIIPPVLGGGEEQIEESALLDVTYSDLILNGKTDGDVRLGNSGKTRNITIDKIEVSWTNANATQRIKKVEINGVTKWSSFFGQTSGSNLDIENVIISPNTSGLVLGLEFNKNLTNKSLTLIFHMSDGSSKTVQ